MADSDIVPKKRPRYRRSRKEVAQVVYTVNKESRYLHVKNVPALGTADELVALFALYGTIDEYRILDEDSSADQFNDVFWFKYAELAEARVAKRKLDDHVFYGSPLQVSYGPEFENLTDTKKKFDERRKRVLTPIPPARPPKSKAFPGTPLTPADRISKQRFTPEMTKATVGESSRALPGNLTPSMNDTVLAIRNKLRKVSASIQPRRRM